jgi:hypothetical protein
MTDFLTTFISSPRTVTAVVVVIALALIITIQLYREVSR